MIQTRRCERVAQAVVQPVVTMFPEFELLGDEPVATPECRERHFAVTESASTSAARASSFARCDRLARADAHALIRLAARGRLPQYRSDSACDTRSTLPGAPADALRASGRAPPRSGFASSSRPLRLSKLV
jgi:hypothetical protein